MGAQDQRSAVESYGTWYADMFARRHGLGRRLGLLRPGTQVMGLHV